MLYFFGSGDFPSQVKCMLSCEVKIHYNVSLYERLEKTVTLFGSNLTVIVTLMLESIQAVVTKEPRLKGVIKRFSLKPARTGHNKVILKEEVFDFYEDWALSCGMKRNPLIQTILMEVGQICEEELQPACLITLEELRAQLKGKLEEVLSSRLPVVVH